MMLALASWVGFSSPTSNALQVMAWLPAERTDDENC
jgi:hypothetical protein